MPYYAVARGRKPGIYPSWEACKRQVHGYSSASFKKFDTEQVADRFVHSTVLSRDELTSVWNSLDLSEFKAAKLSWRKKSDDIPIPKVIPKPDYPVQKIYIDGAARRNGKVKIPKLGFGVYYGPKDLRNAAIPLSAVEDVKRIRPTNQRAELHAPRTHGYLYRHDGLP